MRDWNNVHHSRQVVFHVLLNHLTQEASFFFSFSFFFCVCVLLLLFFILFLFFGGVPLDPPKQQQHQTNMNTDVVFNRLSMAVLPDHRAICVSRGACVD